jgi:hypothetical protein
MQMAWEIYEMAPEFMNDIRSTIATTNILFSHIQSIDDFLAKFILEDSKYDTFNIVNFLRFLYFLNC